MRSLLAGLLLVGSGVLCALLPAMPIASAAPCGAPQASEAEVVDALRLEAVPIDYVLVVDTSGSMQESGLYPKVTSALQTFIAAMKPTDHLSILTFDTAPTLRFSDPVGSDASTALRQLPTTADGQGTDIGAGIEAGIAELERPGAASVGTIVLITDGKIQADGSRYGSATSPNWNLLRERANRLTSSHSITSYAYALTSTTDAALLKTVFDQTLVVDIPPSQVGSLLNRVTEENLRQRAAGVLRRDSRAGVDASWGERLDPLTLDGSSTEIPLTLHSNYSHIPTVVCDLEVEIDGFGVKVSGITQPIELRPNESKTLDVRISVDGMGGFGFGENDELRSGTVNLGASVDSPWFDVITDDFGVEFAPTVRARPEVINVVGTDGWSWARLVAIPLVPLVLVGAVWLLRRLRMRQLTGSLQLLEQGRPVSEFPLGGRVFTLGKAPHIVPDKVLNGTVRAISRTNDYLADTEHGVLIAAKVGSTRRSQRLFDGDSLDIDSVTITYMNNRK